MTTFSPKVELYLNSAWTDVTSHVAGEGQVTIDRGRRSEGQATEPTTCRFILLDDDRHGAGNYSPRNPSGAYYGQLGRGVRCRVSLPADSVRLCLPPAADGTSNARTPDSANLSITGDIDLRADISLKNWGVNYVYPIYKTTAYSLQVDNNRLYMQWNSDASTSVTATCTTTVPTTGPGRLSIRATLDVNNGAGGYTVTFYTSTTAGTAGPWTQLGDPVVGAATTAIYDSTGSLFTYAGTQSTMEVYSIAVYQGIAGTLQANPLFSSQSAGATSFADAQGNTWTLNSNGARLSDRDYRFWGEIAELTTREDPTGKARTTDVVAADLMRRLGNRRAPEASPMSRGIRELDSVVGWWPGEDGDNATTLASGIEGQRAMTIFGTPDMASNTAMFPGAGALMTFDTATRIRTYGFTPYTDTGETQIRFLIGMEGALVDGVSILRVFTTGTAKRWELLAKGTGSLELKAYDESNTQIYASGTLSFGINDNAVWLHCGFTQDGADVDWNIVTMQPGLATGTSYSGTATAATFGIITDLYINWDLSDFSGVVFGQLLVQNDVTYLFDQFGQLRANADENPDDRLRRLVVNEERYIMDGVGQVEDTDDAKMGYQQQSPIGDILRECETQDMGILMGMRDWYGVHYRARDSMYNQDPAVTLVYAAPYSDIKDIEATEDDRSTQNDVTVSRAGGASSRAIDTTSAMSTGEPPDGVGLYQTETTISLYEDRQTRDHAGWRLHLGTVEEPRWTRIEIWAERSAVSDILPQLRMVDAGDRIQITSVPVRRLLWDIDALVLGYTEVLDKFRWHLTFVTTPERAWRVGRFDGTRRWSPVDSALNASVTSSATSFAVKTNSGSLWTTTDVPFDILVNGERMTVGAVSGASSPQTFSSVTRAVNGVTKAHSADEAVELWDPSYWAL